VFISRSPEWLSQQWQNEPMRFASYFNLTTGDVTDARTE